MEINPIFNGNTNGHNPKFEVSSSKLRVKNQIRNLFCSTLTLTLTLTFILYLFSDHFENLVKYRFGQLTRLRILLAGMVCRD